MKQEKHPAKLLRFAPVLVLLPALSFAAEWKNISRSDDMLMQIDPGSITVLRPGVRKAWKEFLYTNPQHSKDGKSFIRTVMLSIYDCTARMVAPIQEVDYDHVMNGSVVASISTPAARAHFLDVVPNSFDEAAMDFVCAAPTRKK
jgi:hypothetical protein